MGILSNLATRAWTTVGRILTFFGRLSDAKRRFLDDREQRILSDMERGNLPPERFPELQRVREENQRINKLKELSENIPKNYNPNYYFKALITVLSTMNRAADSFELNQIYTFKYIGRTPEWYDLNPVVLVTNASGVHFEGVNFHWKDAPSYVESPFRKYKFERVQSKFYKIMPDELDYVLKIPTFYPQKINK